MSASQMRASARQKLNGNYLYAFLFSLLGRWIISAGPSILSSFSVARIITDIITNGGGFILTFRATAMSIFISVVGMILAGSINVGIASYYIKLCDRNNPSIDDIIAPFRNFGNMLKAYIIAVLLIFLKSLLFIIPGFCEMLSLALTPYILAEHPEMDAKSAIDLSKQMMKGNRCRLVRLILSFSGWYFLCIFTFGIGFFFLEPYLNAAMAEFFNEISGKNYQKQLNNINYRENTPFQEVNL